VVNTRRESTRRLVMALIQNMEEIPTGQTMPQEQVMALAQNTEEMPTGQTMPQEPTILRLHRPRWSCLSPWRM